MKIAPFAKKLRLDIAIPIALLVALAALSYRSIRASSTAATWVRHTNEVMGELSALLLALQDLENGSRGFALAGEGSFLIPYDSGRAGVPEHLEAIERLTVDNAVQQQRVHRLAALVAAEEQIEAELIEVRRRAGAGAAAARVAGGAGLHSMNAIRELIREMQNDEVQLLAARQATADALFRRLTLALAFGVVVVGARMVSDNRRLQRTLVQTRIHQEIAAAHAKQIGVINQELEAFSYSVSHDLRAPLRHVNGYVEMLQRDTAGQLSEKSARYLSTINESSLEMGRLIDDLLAFSRVGRSELKSASVSLDDVVKDAIRGLEMSTRDRRIEWRISPLPRVIGDPALLKQVLANLIDNALKYSRTRDPARIEIGSSGRDGNRASLFVRDNGVGFDMKYVQKLFGVFERLHAAENFEGTGIGLATVRRIITRHGGRVWADGAVNTGATFHFTLELSPNV
ncbi:MAG TPA: CHASE3 domain-containing protein [Gemmatimonadaceae bacterium]|nr:CHASE3 domain-containing protein [Gemmatimonadaceae bacterium]